MANVNLWHIATECTREAFAVGRAENIAFGFDDPISYVTAFGNSMPLARPSLALDHKARRVSEIDAINGIVPILGSRHGIKTPYNLTLATLIKHNEMKF